MSKKKFFHKLYPFTLLTILALLAVSCLNNSVDKGDDENEPPEQIETKPVPPDGILETVTWNLEWFGSTSHGPTDEARQATNIIMVMDSLKADLYAFEEVYSQASINTLTKSLKGYHGFSSTYSTLGGSFSQQTAFVFNTLTIDSVSSGIITDGMDRNDWASGRYPFYFQFNYSYQNKSVPVYAVVIHAKANTGDSAKKQEAYNRRKRAAQQLHQYLQSEYPDAHIIIMGDFNDDVDVSIYDGTSPSPYEAFADDSTHFKIVTAPISAKGESSYVAGNYTDLIDHIIISDEMFPYFVPSSEAIFFDAESMINNYSNTTSDHLPVWAKFDITASPKGKVH